MSRLRLASSDGWKARVQSGQPPTPKTVRLTYVAASGDNITEPPPPTGTIFGFNSRGPRRSELLSEYGKVPIGRVYNGGAFLSTNGSYFQPGGICYAGAGLGVAGVTSSKRINMSIIYNPATVTAADSAKCVEVRNFVRSIPDGWLVQIVMYHEWNLHTNDIPGESAGTIADFRRSHEILSNVIYDADISRTSLGLSTGVAIPVINPSSFKITQQDASIANINNVAPTTQLHYDIYDNPNSNPPQYKNYGCTYRPVSNTMQPCYDQANRLGYLGAGHGWGINEINAPRRVAPRLATLDTTNGWGPLSPFDIDGSGMAASLTAMCNFAVNAPVPATTVILFVGTQNSPGAWNQDFYSAGKPDHDPAGALHQGWPITVDPTRPLNAYRNFMNISA